ncbi:hypothetical protein [Brachybacterium paraconglomeratum]|uniref:hypothetical protein n=1 Tax=Brachybacterium paraconglomeratum TaxID=173362 RepID=UPI0022AF7A6F|nr:hypothetical protein [Brachybacterium paraconglomeratum]MCZ4326736.1 hypothetical protein [Brachybacterium paraconglomeratum]
MSSSYSIEQLRAHRRYRDRVRAQALVDLAEGRVSVNDVLLRATTVEGQELMKVTVQQLLLSVPGIGRATVGRVLEALGRLTMHPLPPTRQITINWLLDGRSMGTRMVALTDALAAVAPHLRLDARGAVDGPPPAAHPTPPWDGFPFSPPPPRITIRLGDRLSRPSGS